MFSNFNWAIIAPIFIIQLILIVVALVDLVRSEKTRGPKILWVLIILFFEIVGPILYFVFGRRND